MARSLIVPYIEVLDADLNIEVLKEDEWRRLREARLTALEESPDSFMSNYERERRYGEDTWRAEFSRGEWTVVVVDSHAIGLLGTTRVPDTPRNECYLEYLWIAPEFRRRGIARRLITTVIKRVSGSGVETVWLWILEGNDEARRLYEKLDFAYAGKKQSLLDNPARHEELMKVSAW